MAQEFKTINTLHQDLIHDIAFDWYGQRLATCSTDRYVKIWQKNSQGKWEQIHQIANADGPIRKIKWAHPEFGTILAACSMDRSVSLYEENKDFRQVIRDNNEQSSKKESGQWRITKIYNEKESIEDMKFAPKHLGLILAVGRGDGKISIFQFTDLLNLQIHQKIANVHVSPFGIHSISWNKNRFEKRPMIAVGCRDKDSAQTNNLVSHNSAYDFNVIQEEENKQGYNSCFKILVFDNLNSLNSQDYHQMKLEYSNEDNQKLMHKSSVNDVSWSLINGRSFHLIATCGKEGARIWYVKQSQNQPNTMQVIRIVDLFSQLSNENINESIESQKISWNVMASLVATSDINNEIKIFKASGMGKWDKIKSIKENSDQDYFNNN